MKNKAGSKGNFTRYKHQINSTTDVIKPRRHKGDGHKDKGK